jgi:hypothetical protein
MHDRRIANVLVMMLGAASLPACISNTTRPQDRCQLHSDTLRGEVHRDPSVRGWASMRMGRDPVYEAAKQEHFPWCGDPPSGGCIVYDSWFMPRWTYVWFCGSCRSARDLWTEQRRTASHSSSGAEAAAAR